MRFVITASITPDDHSGPHSITFDAAPWFTKASVKQVAQLAFDGWHGNYSADAVAWGSQHDPRVAAALHYVQEAGVGFEVHVDRTEALKWLQQRRPRLFKAACVGEQNARARWNAPYVQDPRAAQIEATMRRLLGIPDRRPTHLRVVKKDAPVPPCESL